MPQRASPLLASETMQLRNRPRGIVTACAFANLADTTLHEISSTFTFKITNANSAIKTVQTAIVPAPVNPASTIVGSLRLLSVDHGLKDLRPADYEVPPVQS